MYRRRIGRPTSGWFATHSIAPRARGEKEPKPRELYVERQDLRFRRVAN